MTQVTSVSLVGVSGQNENFLQPSSSTITVSINAGDGDDLLNAYGASTYTSIGGFGTDFIFTGNNNDIILGDSFWIDETTNVNPALAAVADMIFAFEGADAISAGGGNNFVNAGSGNDYVLGGSGNEMLSGGGDNDRVYGEAGNDQLFGGTATEAAELAFLNANIGTITTNFNGVTNAAQNTVNNSSDYAGFDLDTFNTGIDYLDGGDGNDTLDGGDGADRLIGGSGNDAFVFSSVLGATNIDKIADFANASGNDDRFELDNAIFTKFGTKTGLMAAKLFKDISLAKEDVDDRILYNPTKGALYYDTDGYGGAKPVQFATLDNKAHLTAADFFVV